MRYILKFRLPNLFTIIAVTNIKKEFLKKKRVKGFFIFMTMLSFKQVESNYGQKESCEGGYSFDVFPRRANFPFKYGKDILRQSRKLKNQNFSLSVNHGHDADLIFGHDSKLLNLCPVKHFSLTSTSAISNKFCDFLPTKTNVFTNFE